MTFLRLNGWRVPVTVRNAPTRKISYKGELPTRFRGKPVRHRKSIESQRSLSTVKLDEECADTLECLLEGRNHQFDFVGDVWSSSGLGPELGSSWTLAASGGPLATRGHYVIAGGGSLIYDTRLVDDPIAPDGGRWSVLFWEQVTGVWYRRVLRSDGTKFENGVSSAATFGLSVILGSVVVSPGVAIADLFVFSSYACESFVVDEYEWVSGSSLFFRWTFDRTFAEDVSSMDVATVVGAAFAKGKIGSALDLSAATDGVTYQDDALLEPDVNGSFTVEFWASSSNLAQASRNILGKMSATDVGWGFTVDGLGVFTWRVKSTVTLNVATTYAFADTASHHFVGTYTSGTVRLYVDGTLASSSAGFTGGSLAGADPFRVGTSVPAGRTAFEGTVEEVRFYDKALLATQVHERFESNRVGQRFPLPRFSSSSPRVDMFGAINGYLPPVEVISEVTGEEYVQRGGSSGWVNNDRQLSIKLDEVKGLPNGNHVPRPDAGFSFMSSSIINPSNSNQIPSPFSGPVVLSGVGMTEVNRSQRGPFGFADKAFTFNGAYGTSIDSNFAQWLYGATSVTVLAWVRATSLVASHVLHLPIDNAGNPRLALRIFAGSGAYAIDARSEAADTTKTATGTSDLVSNVWQLIGGVVELEADQITPYSNGLVEPATTALGFNVDRFSEEGPTVAPYVRLGEDAVAASPWQGQMAGVCVWRRKLEPGEVLNVYELGKQGVFS